MAALLKNRTLLVLLGLVLLALLIWFAGPYFAFADHKPLESVVGRLVAILIMVIAWAVTLQIRQLRSNRASARLADGVLAQPGQPGGEEAAPGGGAARPDAAEATQLRKRFEEAIDALKKSRRKGGANLYELPWYVIIGPPGAGKTTVLANSGLDFPLARQFGKEALRGVGGTRHCDWWFTDRAILLDTAGRYTTQDSDAQADAAGWIAFLKLLRRFRSRQPINGVILAISAMDLITAGEAERERHIQAIRARLAELGQTLGIDVPVYLLVTKCDLVAGFSEFFDDLTQEARAQVWGTTFPIDVTEAGRAPETFAQEFARLIERLEQRMLTRMEAERDARRRVDILGFPQQMAALGPLLAELLRRVFTSTDFEGRILLRGVYFTSGTQEGTPIDRVLGSMARTFGVDGAVVAPAGGRGKAFFIERLLKNVIFRESGLAGINRRLQLWKLAAQSAAYAACVAVLALGVIGFVISYRANAGYIDELAAAIEALDASPPVAVDPRAQAPDPAALERLDVLRGIVETAAPDGAVPWRMRMGLYRGKALGGAAREAYERELNRVLLPALAQRFAVQLRASVAAPDRLYEYLKGYLMLGDAAHRDAEYLRALGDIELRRMYPGDAATRERVGAHLEWLLGADARMATVAADTALVEQARAALRTASLPVLMYSRLKLSYAGDARALRLDLAAGPGADLAFQRAGGAALSDPVPALYTRTVFHEVNGTGKVDLVRQFAADEWVFGTGLFDARQAAALVHGMLELYEQDYIRTWDAVLRDITVKPTANAQALTEQLDVLASPASPLKGLLAVVSEQTDLLEPPAQPLAAAGEAAAAAVAARATQLASVLGAPPAGAAEPGTAVTEHFASIRALLQGPPGATPLDALLVTLGEARDALAALGAGLGDGGALDALVKSGSGNAAGDALKRLKSQARQLPGPLGDMVAQLGERSTTIAAGEARDDLSRRYADQVLRECRELIDGRYPFERTSKHDLPLQDFGRVFGYGGTYDSFFRTHLAALVDTSGPSWRWRPGAAAVGGSSAMLRQFQQAQRIRELYFQPGTQVPEARFTLTPAALDAGATRFTLELDGQRLDYRHGPQQASALRWPAAAVGGAAIAFEQRDGVGPSRAHQGPWAWFRLLDEAHIEAVSDTRLGVTFSAGGLAMRLTLDAASVRNPFVRNALAGFSCAL